MAAAVPFAIAGGSALYSYFKNKKANKALQQNTQAQQGAAQGQFDAAGPLRQQGTALTTEGAGTLNAAGDYYKNILGSRFGARESMAPEITTALDFYKGAEEKNQRTLRGGSRDYAQAELSRQKVGQIAGFLPAARANAAQGALGVGSAQVGGGNALVGQSNNAAATGGYISGGVQAAYNNQMQRQTDSAKAWGQIASGIFGATQDQNDQDKQASTAIWI